MRALKSIEVAIAANKLHRLVLCKYAHGNPNNVNRVRREYNKLALAWVKAEKVLNKKPHSRTWVKGQKEAKS